MTVRRLKNFQSPFYLLPKNSKQNFSRHLAWGEMPIVNHTHMSHRSFFLRKRLACEPRSLMRWKGHGVFYKCGNSSSSPSPPALRPVHSFPLAWIVSFLEPWELCVYLIKAPPYTTSMKFPRQTCSLKWWESSSTELVVRKNSSLLFCALLPRSLPLLLHYVSSLFWLLSSCTFSGRPMNENIANLPIQTAEYRHSNTAQNILLSDSFCISTFFFPMSIYSIINI